MKKVKRFIKSNIFILVVILLSIPAIYPFFNQGFFTMHDDTQVVRVAQMAKALSTGQFPVRWVPDLGYGYGYPIFNFYSPLPYYLGGFVDLIGFTSLTATKLMFVIGILLSGIFMYIFSKSLFGKWGGLLSTILYMYAPYHAVQIYVRGAVGELWAYAFLPLVGYGIVGIVKGNNVNYIRSSVVLSLGFAGIILSHNITALMVSIFLLLFMVCYFLVVLVKRDALPKFKYITGGLFLGLGLSAFFWMPALYELNQTNVSSIIGGTADYHLHFVTLRQLYDSPWGFAGSAPGITDGISFKIGKLLLLLGSLGSAGIVFAFYKKKINKTTLYITSVFLLIGLVSIGMTLQFSTFVWDLISVFSYIQYPWRFLSIIVFSFSFLSGGLALLPLSRRLKQLLIAVLIILFIFINSKYFRYQYPVYLSDSDYANEVYVKWTVSKISDEYLPFAFPKPLNLNDISINRVETESSDTVISNIQYALNKIIFNVTSKKEDKIKINIAYYPNIEVKIDNQKTEPLIENGLIYLFIPEGIHKVTVSFSTTLIRFIAGLCSIVSVIILGYYVKKKS